MRHFATCFLLPFMVLLGWTVISLSEYRSMPQYFVLEWVVFVLFIAPLGAAYATAVIIDAFSPRMMLHARTMRRRCAGAGLLAGVLACALASVGMSYPQWLPRDDLGTAGAAAIATAIVILGSRRLRPGMCATCAYDITRSIDYGRCPECGTPLAA